MKKKVMALWLLLVLLVTTACTHSAENKAPEEQIKSKSLPVNLSVEAIVNDGVLLKASVRPIERMDDHVVLTIDFSISEKSQSIARVNVARLLDTSSILLEKTKVRLVDFLKGRVWEAGWVGQDPVLRSSATTQGFIDIRGPEETKTVVTFFGPVDVDKVDVLIPNMGLVKDVPVVEGSSETADLASLGVKKERPVIYDQPHALVSLVRAYDGDTSAQKQGDAQTVVIASDVLFATDVAELSPEAAARVDEVAAQIAQVTSGGEVKVVGHTDDVASDAYNMDLSLRRATSVANRMAGTLGSSFTVAKEGKGESEPAMKGTDAQARAANRRVEISFTAARAVALSGTSSSIPAATSPTATGHDPVTYTVNNNTYTVRATSVLRRNGYLVGTLVATAVSGNGLDIAPFFLSQGFIHSSSGQEEATPGNAVLQSAKEVALMGPQGRVFPARYWRKIPDNFEGRPFVLADWGLGYSLKAGNSVTYTVVWSDTGEDSVTIDSQKRFRITGIPVEKE